MKTTEDKVLEYLTHSKKPVTVKQLSKQFILSESAVTRTLTNLVERGVVEKIPKSMTFKLKE